MKGPQPKEINMKVHKKPISSMKILEKSHKRKFRIVERKSKEISCYSVKNIRQFIIQEFKGGDFIFWVKEWRDLWARGYDRHYPVSFDTKPEAEDYLKDLLK